MRKALPPTPRGIRLRVLLAGLRRCNARVEALCAKLTPGLVAVAIALAHLLARVEIDRQSAPIPSAGDPLFDSIAAGSL